MCRLAAYLGPAIPLEKIVILPRHSLLQQSQNANEAKLAVNGDGFGITWYDRNEKPGLYRDILPAWSDENLTSICRMVHSSLFLAHVRASTVGETSRVNCHPFTLGRWSFMHNGKIAEINQIRRQLEKTLPDEFYNARRGTTDSELLFLMALSNGLDTQPKLAMQKTVAQIRQTQGPTTYPNRITCVFCNGHTVYGLRHSSDHLSPTLYISGLLDTGGRALASEPLDGDPSNWQGIENDQFVSLSPAGMEIEPFDVAA